MTITQENKVAQATIVPDMLKIVLDIIERKEAHKKEGYAIERLEAFYSAEIHAMKGSLHRVGGKLIPISTMTDEHLINTIKQKLIHNRGNFKALEKKYTDEAKRRPEVLDRILAIETNELVPHTGYEPMYRGDQFDFEI